MDPHGNAALSWCGRRELARRVVEQGWTLGSAASAAGVSVRCARKWVGRYRAGDRDLLDRSSAPDRVANRTDPARVEVIVKLRRLRMTAAEIAETLGIPHSTVSGILTRIGLGRLGRIGLEPAGSGTTTIDADTQHSTTKPQSPEPTCSGLTTSRPQSKQPPPQPLRRLRPGAPSAWDKRACFGRDRLARARMPSTDSRRRD